MGDAFEMINAFSRDGPKKVYVQHLLKERAQEINDLLEKKAYIYVCGDAANMAREVNTVLGQIIAQRRGIPESKAEEIVKNMRAANQYQVRLVVSSSILPHTNVYPRRMSGRNDSRQELRSAGRRCGSIDGASVRAAYLELAVALF